MTDRSAPLHLRLVAAREPGDEKAAKPLPPRDKQLSFPYPETSTVFLVYIDSIGKEEFARILGDYAPRWIIDVRAVPRLDTIAASRLSAFTLFERAKASYVDLFGRLGIKSYRSVESNPAFWGNAVFDLLKDTEKKGPYLFLFDNEQLLRAADDVLPDVIMPVIGKTARFAHIGRFELDRRPPG
jgi:hypothetical protein